MTNLHEWQVEVAKAIRQLSQEVHVLNPGIRYEFNLLTILAPLEGEPIALAQEGSDGKT